jgi:Trk K+ transport system NAD-binding subunit
MNDIVWLTMRRMRTPLIALILIYSLSVIGLVHIPTVDPAGNQGTMGYLDAAYFVAILSTTIGFGEIPYAFSQAQRLYVFIILLPNVVAWLYSIGTILGLFLDPQFRSVMRMTRFSQRIKWLGDDFYIVCGFGNTGSMITQGLLNRGLNAVVLERDEDVVHRLSLVDAFSHLPALAGESTDRRLLEMAGLHRSNCRGIIAITNEDHANLMIAITAKLLRPELPVLARSENQRVSANLDSFGTDFIIDPYTIFAERLFLLMSSPTKYLVQDWLISVPGSDLRERVNPPSGRWIIAGMGRFGSSMAKRLDEAALPYTVIDVRENRIRKQPRDVLGRGTEASTLIEADINNACGIIAGTGDDVDNLSIIMTAKTLNPNLFMVARQENQQNDELFDASGAHLIARRSLIVARRVLAVATTPLLQIFLEHMVAQDDEFAHRVHARLASVLMGKAPHLWIIHLEGHEDRGIHVATLENVEVRLEHITHNTRSESSESLDCVPLVLERGALRIFLPEAGQQLHEGDRLLFAGRGSAHKEMLWALHDPDLLMSFATGRHAPSGSVGRWLERRKQARKNS